MNQDLGLGTTNTLFGLCKEKILLHVDENIINVCFKVYISSVYSTSSPQAITIAHDWN